MIQANELRIRNAVTRNNEAWYVNVISHKVEIDQGEEGVWVNYDELERIPLTEEWLLKFGFTKEKDMFYFKYGVITYALCADNHGFVVGICNNPNIDWFSWEIKYVNQLQNLFYAITGSELVLSTVPEAILPSL